MRPQVGLQYPSVGFSWNIPTNPDSRAAAASKDSVALMQELGRFMDRFDSVMADLPDHEDNMSGWDAPGEPDT